MSLNLPVSVGEAVDKLSILDIKLKKINSPERITDVRKERDMISIYVKDIIEKYEYLYKWLIYINTYIWDIQDLVRESETYLQKYASDIQKYNDMRFRIKNKLNYICNSDYKEQKGYSIKTGLFITHLGLGDLINMNGAIRFLSLEVDHLFVICPKNNIKNVSDIFADDSSIEIICVDNNDECKNYNTLKIGDVLLNKKLTHFFKSGIWGGFNNFNELPYCFYDQLRLPREIKNIFFYMPPQDELLEPPTIPYIFCHSTSSSTSKLTFIKWNVNDILTIDPNTNHYSKEDKWYCEAEKYINKPILKYIDVIKNASEIHVTNSSFQCLACYIDLKATIRKCYDRNTGIVDTHMTLCLR